MPWLGIYFVVLAPVVGGLIYGPLIQRFAPEARGHGKEEGTLSLAAILPVSPRSVVLQKVGALTLQALLLAIATMVCLVVGRQFDLSIPLTHLAGLSLGVTLLGVDFGLCALALGSITGSRLVSGEFTRPGDRMDSPSSVRFALLLVSRNQQLANGLSLASVGVLTSVGALLTLTAGCRVPEARPPLIRSRQSESQAGGADSCPNRLGRCGTVARSYGSDRR